MTGETNGHHPDDSLGAASGAGAEVLLYDRWDWHTSGVFPRDVPPEQGFVHIAMFVTWLIRHDMVDPAWASSPEVRDAVEAIRANRAGASTLREALDGTLSSEILRAEGRRFSTAYYLPPFGFPEEWRRLFGAQADRYEVPDTEATYERLAPEIDRAYRWWVERGRPEWVERPEKPGLLERLTGFLRR